MPLWAELAATHQFDTDSRFLIEIETPPIQRSSDVGAILEIAYHLLSEQNTGTRHWLLRPSPRRTIKAPQPRPTSAPRIPSHSCTPSYRRL